MAEWCPSTRAKPSYCVARRCTRYPQHSGGNTKQREQEQDTYDEQIKFVDKHGNAVKHASYRVYSYGTELSSGTTDGNGMTDRITTKDKTWITNVILAVNDLKLYVDLDGVATNSTDLGSSVVTKTLQLDTVEVIVSDRLPNISSTFGHIAIAVNEVVYSRAHSTYVSMPHGQYVDIQQKIRDSRGYVLRVLPIEKGTIENELKRRVAVTKQDPEKHSYNIISNSCSSNIADVLDMAGVGGTYDSRGFGIVSPSDFTVALPRSKRLIDSIYYRKN
jgi:hypothetical protein